ncbi:MAG: hypothetical protein ACKOJF_09600, partial [Planctomycetaceae bacterium]
MSNTLSRLTRGMARFDGRAGSARCGVALWASELGARRRRRVRGLDWVAVFVLGWLEAGALSLQFPHPTKTPSDAFAPQVPTPKTPRH